MIRLALLLLLAISALTFACGGDDDSDSPTPSSEASADASSDTSATPTEQWTGALSGAVTGAIENTLSPQCGATGDSTAISLGGIVGGESVVVSILTGGPGTFDMSASADESPTVDVAISSDPPGEWNAAAGGSGSGELIIEDDGSGSANVTLPTIVSTTQDNLTLTAEWTCSAQ